MKVVILAGGMGTRLSEYTDIIPKPMVKIGEKPIIHHIMQIFADHGHKEFLIALGYKGEKIKEYFLSQKNMNSDLSIDLSTGKIKYLQENNFDWIVNLIDTGLNTMTGGRIKRLKEKLNNERFFLTYGDGISNVNIHSLLDFHAKHGRLVTITAVRPNARFGELTINNGKINSFDEKPQLQKGWINGGFMVIEPEFLSLIKDDNTMLERDPFKEAVNKGELMAYCHEGFWQCMDNKRDLKILNEMFKKGNTPWIKKK